MAAKSLHLFSCSLCQDVRFLLAVMPIAAAELVLLDLDLQNTKMLP